MCINQIIGAIYIKVKKGRENRYKPQEQGVKQGYEVKRDQFGMPYTQTCKKPIKGGE